MTDATNSKIFTVDDTIVLPCAFRPRFLPHGTIDANGNFSIEFIDTAPDSVTERLRRVRNQALAKIRRRNEAEQEEQRDRARQHDEPIPTDFVDPDCWWLKR